MSTTWRRACNGCRDAELRRQLGKKYLKLNVEGWPTVYELGTHPVSWQGEPMQHNDRLSGS